MSIRAFVVLAAVLCAAPLTVLNAQQVADSATVAVTAGPVQVSPAPASSTVAQSGPRVAPQFQRAEAAIAPRSSSERSSVMQEGESHSITISTLALVLGIIIIVLLIVR